MKVDGWDVYNEGGLRLYATLIWDPIEEAYLASYQGDYFTVSIYVNIARKPRNESNDFLR